MLVARKASCCVANVFSTGLKVIWPRSSLKITKMSKKCTFCKVPRVNGLMWVSESSFGSVLKSISQREFVCFPSLFGQKLVWHTNNKKRLLMSYFQIYFLWGWFSKITRHENVRRPIFNTLVKENEGQIKQKTTFALAPSCQKVILMLTFRGYKKFDNSFYLKILGILW